MKVKKNVASNFFNLIDKHFPKTKKKFIKLLTETLIKSAAAVYRT